METGSSVKTTLKLPGKKDFFTQEAFKTLRTNLQFCGQDIAALKEDQREALAAFIKTMV